MEGTRDFNADRLGRITRGRILTILTPILLDRLRVGHGHFFQTQPRLK